MRLKARLRGWIARGELRTTAARLVYDTVIVMQLAVEQMLDFFRLSKGKHPYNAVQHDLTVMVKTFERPGILSRLVKSIKSKYPGLRIIVIDDSRCPQRLPGVDTIFMPYDCGVSAGRNEGLRHVTTKYVLVVDDDYIFYRHTNLNSPLLVMQSHPEIDIMGGEVIDLPFFEAADYSRGGLFHTDAEATMPPGSSIGGLPVHDKTANFYIARTDRIRLIGWDPKLKRVDHSDFFTRAKGTLTTVFNKDMKCLHAKTPFDRIYMSKRKDFDKDFQILHLKYHHDRRESRF